MTNHQVLIVSKRVSWEANQIEYKPDQSYAHHPNPPAGQSKNRFEPWLSRNRDVLDHHEVMAFVARPRSEALGARGNVAGFEDFDMALDLKISPQGMKYPFGKDRSEHSGQYQRPIQKTHKFYNTLLERMKFSFNFLSEKDVGDKL